MSTGKKILRWLIIIVAVLVLLGSIAGIAGTWWLHSAVTDVTLQAFSTIDTAVGVVDTAASRADDLVQRGRTEVQQVEETIIAVGTDVEANKPLLTELSSRINERLTPTVEQLRTTLAPVSGAIQSVRALVDFINAIPFISETPPAVEELESALNRLDEAAANARQVGDTIKTTVVDGSSQMTQQTVDLLTSLTSGVDDWLAEAQSAVDTLQTEMAALQERLALLRSQLLLLYSLAAVGATLLLFWIIYSQVVVIRHQWQLLRAGGKTAVDAMPPAAVQPVIQPAPAPAGVALPTAQEPPSPAATSAVEQSDPLPIE
jgi:phage shock protein A